MKGKSGLFSVLPPPKNATTKEVGRDLLPHSLSKKTTTATSASTANRKGPTQSFARTEPLPVRPNSTKTHASKEDSDDDDDGSNVNFFSLGSKPDDTTFTDDTVTPGVSATAGRARSEPIHEPSLRGPWLGPAMPASNLLGTLPAGPMGTAQSDILPRNEKPAGVHEGFSEPVAGSSASVQGPEYTTQVCSDYGQVGKFSVCRIKFRNLDVSLSGR